MKKILYLIILIILIMGCKMKPSGQNHKPNFWHKDGYCKQTNIDLSKIDQKIIRAKIEGKWQDFKIQELPDAFMEWSIKHRLETLKRIKTGGMPELAGSHNGMVASHGLRRSDASFSINNAVKGMGFLPKPDKIEQILSQLKATFDAPLEQKLAYLESLYQNSNEIFDRTKQTSLELYATPEFETHTFLNQMTDPGVAIVFLDFPSFELRAITQLVHPQDPSLSQYEKNVVDYINTIHDYFHAPSPRASIAVIYHIIEVFDNTPGKARGKRITPPLL
ncbi:MAG: hypothetical protein ABIK31_02490 [candidate division WOR-3 bacterium]